MTGTAEAIPQTGTKITFRSLLLGALLVAPTSLLVAGMEEVYGGRPTYLSVFFHAVLVLIILVGFNALLRVLVPRYAFNRAELLIIYVMMGVSSGIVGDQFMAILIPSLAHPFRYATEANLWETKLWPYLPAHAVVSDPVAVRNFFEGGSTLYLMSNLRPWLVPGLLWASFIAVTQLMCLGINIIMRRQWTDYEKLSFPLTLLPMEITGGGQSSIWRNKLMWLGFGIAAFISIVNELNVHWPVIPPIPVKVHWITFPARWHAAFSNIGTSCYPFVIGIAFLLPSDLTFSTWFFFIVFRLERIFFSALGFPSPYPWTTGGMSQLPAILEQGIGAYIAVVVFALWAGRRHLTWVWNAIWNLPGAKANDAAGVPDPREVTEYRLALGCIVGGLVLSTWFATTLGMSAAVGFIYIILYLIINTAIAKVRAEAGAPTHGFHFAGPDHILLTVVGPSSRSTRQLAGWALFFGFNRSYPGVPMPHQLEGMKMGELVGAERQRVSLAVAVATVVGSFAGVWALLHFCYREGVEQMLAPVKALSPQGWGIATRWMNSPTGPNWVGLEGIVFGFLFACWLMWMRFHFVWWPFHPIGYAIAPDWTTGLIWIPLIVGWLGKSLIMRYLGPRSYQAAVPFALGLIIGEFTMGGFWAVLAMITRHAQYFFWT